MAQLAGLSIVNGGIVNTLVSQFKGESLPRPIPGRAVGFEIGCKSGGRSFSPSSTPPRVGVAAAFMTGNELECYRILGVSRGASKKEIKMAFRRLVIEYHPDRKGESSTAKMAHIVTAYKQALNQLPLLSDDISYCEEYVEGCFGVGDDTWEFWEEWMGFEGAGTYDFTNHIRP